MNRRERRRQAKEAKGAGKESEAAEHAFRGEQLAGEGKIDEAIEAFRQAVSIDPHFAAAHHNSGILLRRRGRLGEAVESYRRATAIQPDFVDAHYNLGNALLDQGDVDGGVASYQKALAIKPDFAQAHNNLGNALTKQGKFDEALKSYQTAIAIEAGFAEAHKNLGNALQKLGKREEAVSSYGKAVAIKPDFADAHNNLGAALEELGRLDEAVASYHQALAVKPENAEAHYNLGNALLKLERPDEALASCQKALAINPDYAEAHNSLGAMLKELGRLDEAIAGFHQALAIKPEFSEAHCNLGMALLKRGKLDEAATSFQRAISIKPDYPEAHNDLGNALKDLGRLDQAIASYRQALSVRPGYETAMVNLLHQLRHACAWAEVDEFDLKVRKFTEQSIRDGRDVTLKPFSNITSSDDVSENFAVAQARSGAIAKKFAARKAAFQMPAESPPSPKITIGYVSNDFHNHATAHLMLSLFGLHDREKFNVFTFSHGPNDDSVYRKKIKNDSDRFFDLEDCGHVEAAGKIFEAGVDILVDLKGHTHNNRLEIFALRPAPVQAAYLGFPGTTGADFMDYIITDRIVTPEDHSPYYSEQFAYLPHSYQINDNGQKFSDVPFTRPDLGLPEKGFVFCSFNGNYKIEPVMFDVWMNLLEKTPDSVLWLFKSNDLSEANLKNQAKARGLDEGRLIFAGHLPKDQHLARCRLADLALDTRICGGHTTTSDLLWSGVPVITMLGAHFASRVSASLLNAVGLPQLITENLANYQALALKLSRQPDALNELKTKLAGNRLSQPLFDTPRFVSNLERAYGRMWENYLSGEEPSRIDVMEG